VRTSLGSGNHPLSSLSSRAARCSLKPFRRRVLEVFRDMDRDPLDLHALFKAGVNEPLHRVRVLDAIENRIRKGKLEAGGGDSYS
jgi:hypothetical protein